MAVRTPILIRSRTVGGKRLGRMGVGLKRPFRVSEGEVGVERFVPFDYRQRQSAIPIGPTAVIDANVLIPQRFEL